MVKTDVVVTTCNRLPYLKRTLEGIFSRTRTPYAVHVVDDNSKKESIDYLLALWRQGKIESLILRNSRCGLRAGLNVGFWLAFSDPMVFTGDDTLCPDLDPDWLARGLAAMRKYKELGLLALNNPACHMLKGEGKRRTDGDVVFGGNASQFLFTRRTLCIGWNPMHVQGQKALAKDPRSPHRTLPDRELINRAKSLGFKFGYLRDVYCFHFGEKPARRDKKVERILKPVNMKTLEPPERWRF